MRILYIHGSSQIEDIIHSLIKLKADFEVYPEKLLDVFANKEKAEKLASYIKAHGITHVMSIHLIDTIAAAVQKTDVIYISIIWDAPYDKLFTAYGRMDNCRYSIFDKVDARRFTSGGITHVLYQPLAVDAEQILEWDAERRPEEKCKYDREVCFVGSLYDDNLYDEFCDHMPQMLQEYFVGVFENAAFRWDGINRINGTVSNELVSYIRKVTPGFQMVNFFDISDSSYFEHGYLIRKIANIERVCVLNLLAERYPVTLYTTSKSAEERLNNVRIMPPVFSERDVHYIFKGSKINLNISLKGIEGGTPQRIMDILGAGGFCMTNYCAETAELFEEDREIVMFRTPEELVDKAEYYLTHDKEREEIAKAGHKKVMDCYTCDKKLKQLMEWVEKDG